MRIKSKIEIEFDNIDSLCEKLYLELQRQGALKQFIRYSIDYMDEDFLKELNEIVEMRLEELKNRRLGSWDEVSVKIYLRKLSQDAGIVLFAIKYSGSITKSALMEKTGFSAMKIAGLLAGMNNMAKTMRKRPVISRSKVRVDGRWDIEYRLEESFLKAMEASSKK
jgi:hypothetical protein